MKIKIGASFLTAIVLLNLPACSYIKTMFPDKEKDYQYTTEIPPLILPEDLKKSHIPGLTASTPSAPPIITDTDVNAPVPTTVVNVPVEEPKSAAPMTKAPAVTTPVPDASVESGPVVPDTAIMVERIKFKEGENRLRINVPFTKAWRIVSKALTRKFIEVTERNQEARFFTVQYDPDEDKAKEESYWDEVVFMFSGIGGNEKTYLLKLDENNQQTDITVVDKEQKPLSDAGSVKLLNLVEETIKADMAKK